MRGFLAKTVGVIPDSFALLLIVKSVRFGYIEKSEPSIASSSHRISLLLRFSLSTCSGKAGIFVRVLFRSVLSQFTDLKSSEQVHASGQMVSVSGND